jgi:hypothetical protein
MSLGGAGEEEVDLSMKVEESIIVAESKSAWESERKKV